MLCIHGSSDLICVSNVLCRLIAGNNQVEEWLNHSLFSDLDWVAIFCAISIIYALKSVYAVPSMNLECLVLVCGFWLKFMFKSGSVWMLFQSIISCSFLAFLNLIAVVLNLIIAVV